MRRCRGSSLAPLAADTRTVPRHPGVVSAGAGRGRTSAWKSPNNTIARTIVGTAAASTSHRSTHQLASHQCVASHQASGVNDVPVPLLHSTEADTSHNAAAKGPSDHEAVRFGHFDKGGSFQEYAPRGEQRHPA
jgi:hypothetical protein